MGKFDKYKVDLKGMQSDSAHYEFSLDNQFFADVDSEDVQRGKVHVVLDVRRTSGAYELDFQTDGIVWVACDRCLDDMEQPVTSTDSLLVKLGEEYSEVDDLVVIPEEEGYINVAWFIYEFVSLAIPMKHVHPFGKCNKMMSSKLREHLCVAQGDEEELMDLSDVDATDGSDACKSMDPRWNELKKLLDNN